jgi:hypothetical protein
MGPDRTSPYQLLVEGVDDKHSIIQLLKRHGFDWEDGPVKPYIHTTGGVDSLLDAFPVALKNYRRVGVVLDADLEPAGRWQAIVDKARPVGVSLPPEPISGGTVVPSTQPSWRCGVWLMPNNGTRGTLEDFLALLVPPGNPVWEHSEEATRRARERGAPLAEKDHLKGALHAWLSWQVIPGQPFGTAITARTFRHDSTEALQFVEWFKELFVK